MYPFFYRPMYTILEDGWCAFQAEAEFAKLVGAKADGWRISHVNSDYQISNTYPSSVIVPKSIDDKILKESASFRVGGRFPVLSYRNEKGVSQFSFRLLIKADMRMNNRYVLN
jgi:myotubularin-related protein 9